MRTANRLIVFLAALLLADAAASQDWPARKPITLIVPAPPGVASDILARVLANKLIEDLGQSVVVLNRAGASSTIGTVDAAKSAPDGYTLLMAGTSFTTNFYTTKDSPPLSAFNPGALAGKLPYTLMVSAKLPARNMKDLVALLKANKGKYNAAVSGFTGTSFFLLEVLKKAGGVEFELVNYKGSNDALTDVLEGRVEMLISPIATAVPHYKAGKAQIHGVTGPTRSPAIPDVPTFAESGYPQMDVPGWLAVMAPAGTPRPVITRLNQSINKALAARDVIEKMSGVGVEPMSGTPEEMDAFLKKDSAMWGKMTADAGVKPE